MTFDLCPDFQGYFQRNLRSVPFQCLKLANFGIFVGDMDLDRCCEVTSMFYGDIVTFRRSTEVIKINDLDVCNFSGFCAPGVIWCANFEFGVTMDRHISYQAHIDKTTQKCNGVLIVLIHAKHSMPKSVIKAIHYCTGSRSSVPIYRYTAHAQTHNCTAFKSAQLLCTCCYLTTEARPHFRCLLQTRMVQCSLPMSSGSNTNCVSFTIH